MAPLVIVTGFGSFEDVERNPSGELARALEREPPSGIEVRGFELPVTFDGAPVAVKQAVEKVLPARPVALVGLGVQSKEKMTGFRLERNARGHLEGDRTDNSGESASTAGVDAGGDMRTFADLEGLAHVMRGAGARDVIVSEEAGGYVCERAYHALLSASSLLGATAVFLHLPQVETVETEDQLPIVSAMLGALVASVVQS